MVVDSQGAGEKRGFEREREAASEQMFFLKKMGILASASRLPDKCARASFLMLIWPSDLSLLRRGTAKNGISIHFG
jgi:hypothetical protein